ncbi:hypothetical protein ACNF49_30755 [Actinomadura sp. ATCC 39365]|uniref:hypothetical protein n=1 Tax=Nonomuraea sp. NPDC005692 TaxID=3157168 RepID=UPI0033C4A3A4
MLLLSMMFGFLLVGGVLSAGMWAVGAFSNNYTQSVNGKKGFLLTSSAALVLGALTFLWDYVTPEGSELPTFVSVPLAVAWLAYLLFGLLTARYGFVRRVIRLTVRLSARWLPPAERADFIETTLTVFYGIRSLYRSRLMTSTLVRSPLMGLRRRQAQARLLQRLEELTP